jgi:Uma2 family endonuclease
MATPTRLTLQDFLVMPETKPYKEYVRGEVVSKTMPNASHSALVTFLCARLLSWTARPV